MRVSLSMGLLLLVPGWAQAGDPADVVAAASARDVELVRPGVVTDPPSGLESAAYVRVFEARAVGSFERSVERAVEGVVSALEARASERMAAALDRSVARQIEGRMRSGPAHATPERLARVRAPASAAPPRER